MYSNYTVWWIPKTQQRISPIYIPNNIFSSCHHVLVSSLIPILPTLILPFPHSHSSFLMSLFFTNANMAACIAALAYFLFFFVQIVILNRLSVIPVAVVMLLVS